jgi:hypothetical protein
MISNIIVKHIFNYWGIPEQRGMCAILSPEYKLKQKLSTELEDGEVLQHNIWGITGKIGESIIKAIVVDLSVSSKEREYALVFQFDELSIYALHLENDQAKAYCLHNDENWLELSNLLLAKLLVGIEQLNELFVAFKSFDEYQKLYSYLVGFINYNAKNTE